VILISALRSKVKLLLLQVQSINRISLHSRPISKVINDKRWKTDARRSNLEQIRNEQRARSISLATGGGTSGGGYVSGSSARGGAYGGISGQANTNLLSNQQALQTGENVFAANANISQSNIQMNDLQTQYALQQANTNTAKANLQYSYAPK